MCWLVLVLPQWWALSRDWWFGVDDITGAPVRDVDVRRPDHDGLRAVVLFVRAAVAEIGGTRLVCKDCGRAGVYCGSPTRVTRLSISILAEITSCPLDFPILVSHSKAYARRSTWPEFDELVVASSGGIGTAWLIIEIPSPNGRTVKEEQTRRRTTRQSDPAALSGK